MPEEGSILASFAEQINIASFVYIFMRPLCRGRSPIFYFPVSDTAGPRPLLYLCMVEPVAEGVFKASLLFPRFEN